jgi:hypothetical protein
MPDARLNKVQAKTAAELVGQLELAEPARACLRDGVSPAEYLNALMKGGHLADAVRFLALALPKPEAIWWACRCARASSPGEPTPGSAAALAAVEGWLADATDEHRRAAKLAADAAPLGTPAGCAALAVFLSGGSMAPPDLKIPVVPPPEGATARAVAGAVLLAGVVAQPDQAEAKYRRYLDDGIQIGSGFVDVAELARARVPSA